MSDSTCPSIFRMLRDEFFAIPNVDLENCHIGGIGTYDNRWGRFDFHTNLAGIGITPAEIPLDPVYKEVIDFADGGETNVTFTGGAGDRGAVTIQFGDKAGVVLRALRINFRQYDIFRLEKAIAEALEHGLHWERDWCVITGVSHAQSCTIVYSSSKDATIELKTSIPVPDLAFDIGDASLGLSITKRKGKVAMQQGANVMPFYKVHKLKGWTYSHSFKDVGLESIRLEPYGRA